jgi:hypothetical protein
MIISMTKPFWLKSSVWITLFILLGCGLRLIWPEDMKWKADEIWMYETARSVINHTTPWPSLGMGNGVGFLNPGLSVWIFIGLAAIAPDPVSMVQWVQVSNVLAIALWVGFIRRYVPQSEQEVWLWGMAIASVNPLAVHFSRAIWATDILPLVGFLVFVGHWWRDKRWGALTWGFVGTLIGQIHMSGFFWQGGLVIWTLLKTQNHTRWRYWLLGTSLGIIPMLPWLAQMGGQAIGQVRPSWAEILTPNFHLHWLLMGWGLEVDYEFGAAFWRMTNAPAIFVALGLAIGAIITIWRAPDRALVRDYFGAGAIVMPVLLLLARVRIPAHYLIVLFPFTQIWVAWLLRGRVKLLMLVCFAQLFLTVYFLGYVHIHGGIPDGNYGLTYRVINSSNLTGPQNPKH